MTDARDPLAIDVETMRALGYRAVDRVLAWMVDGRPGVPRISREAAEAALHGPPPDGPVPVDEVLLLAQAGRTDEIAEQGGHGLPRVPNGRLGRERRAAPATESLTLRVLGTAG
jgi:hypothetical protein